MSFSLLFSCHIQNLNFQIPNLKCLKNFFVVFLECSVFIYSISWMFLAFFFNFIQSKCTTIQRIVVIGVEIKSAIIFTDSSQGRRNDAHDCARNKSSRDISFLEMNNPGKIATSSISKSRESRERTSLSIQISIKK